MDKIIRMRSLYVGIAFMVLFVVIISRLYWVQVVSADELQSQAEKRWQATNILQAKRGAIVDRNGKPLAEEMIAYIVALDPQTINANQRSINLNRGGEAGIDLVKEMSSKLAEILNQMSDAGEQGKLQQKIAELAVKKKSDSDSFMREVLINTEGYGIDGETKQQIDAYASQLSKDYELRSTGIILKETTKRFYPNDHLASHILGYLDRENKAIMGLEASLDEVLSGTDGTIQRKRDAKGIEIPNSKNKLEPAVDGGVVQLTIDQNIQYYMEKALQKSYKEWRPKSISAIAVDPQTMEILAMANMPDFDPNRYWDINSQKDFYNHAIASQYEPGSTFKIVTLAAAIEEGVFDPEELFQSGTYNGIPGPPVKDHNVSGWGKITYLEGLLRSSNVAFARLGYEKLGKDKLLEYIKRFGFSEKSGIDLSGEASGQVHLEWPSDVARATYGQGNITATTLQLTAAYAAIANGGKLFKPYIVKSVEDPDAEGGVHTTEPTFVRQVVSEEAARQTSLYLEQVVADQERGTGKTAYINGYRVAGKTGTANIVKEGENHYSTDTWAVSFVGYAPVENPRILIAVIADEPRMSDYKDASKVAIPVFTEIMTQSLSYLNVPTSTPMTSTSVTEPMGQVKDVVGLGTEDAVSRLTKTGFKVELIGNGGKVLKQSPRAGSEITLSQTVYLLTRDESTVIVPDLTGKALRDALEVCSLIQLKCQTEGEGYVVAQELNGEGANRVLTLQLASVIPKADPSEDEDGSDDSEDPNDSDDTGNPDHPDDENDANNE